MKPLLLISILAAVAACQENTFEGKARPSKALDADAVGGKPQPEATFDTTAAPATAPSISPTTASSSNPAIEEKTLTAPKAPGSAESGNTPITAAPEATISEGELNAPFPDLTSCAALPQAGKINYGTTNKCADNWAVVVVNDGTTREMTCCPLKSKNILSTVPAEKQVQRNTSCAPDEVVTGMLEATPVYFCTKINVKFFKVGTTATAVFANGDKDLSPLLRALADSYNVGDTCACQENFLMQGGHVPKDNQCKDACVKLVRAK